MAGYLFGGVVDYMTIEVQQDWQFRGLHDENELAKRIDLARFGLYRQISRTASSGNFYFESILNLFTSIAQQPISFAVLRNQDGQLKPIFHMCTDKKYQSWFEGLLHSKVFTASDNCFPLFPDVLGDDYCISIWMMHTKIPLRNEYTTLIPVPGRADWEQLASGRDPEVFAYVADCAERFFSQTWDAFRTDFAEIIAPAVRLSLEKLEGNHIWQATKAHDRKSGAQWPPDSSAQIAEQQKIAHPNSDKHDWHKHLAKTLGSTMAALEFGTHAISSLLRVREDIKVSPDGKLPAEDRFVENTILFYRAFDRDPVDGDLGRHLNGDGSYPYNVRMLLPSSNNGEKRGIERFFDALRAKALVNSSIEAAGGPQWTYASLVDCDDIEAAPAETRLRCALMTLLDEWFWTTLKEEEGPQTLVNILASPVGNETRSVADPVFYSGLIHINSIFEFGGLDRVQLERLPKAMAKGVLDFAASGVSGDDRSDLLQSLIEQLNNTGGVCNDICRIVTFYYLTVAMVGGGAPASQRIEETYTGKHIAAILMPIKIRGSVWAVSLHATLRDPQGPRHLPSWMTNFLLMTNHLDILNFVIDRTLWDNLERRLTAVLAKEIGRGITPRAGGFEGLEVALERVNAKLAGEARLVPFVLPQFRLNWQNSKRSSEGSIVLFEDRNIEELITEVQWNIAPNPFFVARQDWTGKTSRSLEPAIELGLNYGLGDLALLRVEASDINNNNGVV